MKAIQRPSKERTVTETGAGMHSITLWWRPGKAVSGPTAVYRNEVSGHMTFPNAFAPFELGQADVFSVPYPQTPDHLLCDFPLDAEALGPGALLLRPFRDFGMRPCA